MWGEEEQVKASKVYIYIYIYIYTYVYARGTHDEMHRVTLTANAFKGDMP